MGKHAECCEEHCVHTDLVNKVLKDLPDEDALYDIDTFISDMEGRLSDTVTVLSFEKKLSVFADIPLFLKTDAVQPL